MNVSPATTSATHHAAGRRAPLARTRVLRLRQGHFVLGVLWFTTHEVALGGFTARRLGVAFLFGVMWYSALRWTLLRESRSAPGWAVVVVRAIEAGFLAGAGVLATDEVLGRGDPLRGELGAVGAMSLIAFLWQATVAGHHTLGEPLRCVLIGPGEIVRAVEEERLAPGARAFEVVGWLDDRAVESEGRRLATNATCLGTLDDLERVAYGGGVDLFVIGVRAGRPALYARLLELTYLDVSVIEYPAFYERTFGCVPLSELTPTWFLHTMHLHRRDEQSLTKRLVDIVGAAIGLVLAAPLFALAALAIRRSGSGPVMFRQQRIGAHGQRFTMLKFRSMRVASAGEEATWTQDEDPRVTRVGRVLRRYRIDELPQLVNVMRGEMTLVGPRPETPDYVRWLAEEIPFYQPRHFTKPGITGWAQVCIGYAASVEDTRRKLSYDLYYLRNRSLSLDFAIMLRTIATIFTARGSR